MPDTAFVAHLVRGGELLRAEKLDEALPELRAALALKPGDGKVLNLLGLATFRLGRLSEAREIFADLAGRQPNDAAMRLNLGLVHLKVGDVDDAIRELSRARELDETQTRTLGYLGLAYARKGEFALARDAFRAAGQEDLAREMEQQLPEPEAAAASEPEPAPAPEPAPEPVPAQVTDVITSRVAASPSASSPGAPLPLPVLASARLLRADVGDLPIELGPGHTLVVRVRGKMLARAEGILARSGELHWEPAQRRMRGRIVDEPFGSLCTVTGDGHFVAASTGTFTAVLLAGDVLYLRESAVFAFEERLGWENGRVPGNPGEIAVVQLRGDGCLATLTAHPPLSLELKDGRPLAVAPAALIGWTGRVVPRLVETGGTALVECTGDGMVLVEEPARATQP